MKHHPPSPRSTEEILSQIDALEKHSRRSWPFIAIGLLAIVGSLYYSAFRLHQVQKELKNARTDLVRVSEEIERANAKKNQLEAETQSMERNLADLKQQVAEMGKIAQELETSERGKSRWAPSRLADLTQRAEVATAQIQRLQIDLSKARSAASNQRLFFHVVDERDRAPTRAFIRDLGMKVESIELKTWAATGHELRFFHEDDAGGADEIAAALARHGLKVSVKYVKLRDPSTVRPETFEVWLGKQPFK